MIRIYRPDQTTVRIFEGDSAEIEFHDQHGFVSPGSLASRRHLREGSGLSTRVEPANFSLVVGAEGRVLTKGAARAEVIAEKIWKISSDNHEYFLEIGNSAEAAEKMKLPVFKQNGHWLLRTLLVLAVILIVSAVAWLIPKAQETVEAKKDMNDAPVVIHETPPPVKKQERATADPSEKARKALTQQLGFLGIVGRKDFNKKVQGGLPTEAAHTTAGAGAGGDAGSGGQLLAGLGRGLHQTTVGNSGVSGLGGIGTKGAGGGAGGYGDTSFGGAGGQLLSAIPLAHDAAVDDGLDPSQVQATIMRYLSQVRACYEEGLKRDPKLIGQVMMSFEINAAGALNFARVARSSLNDRQVESCISTKMMYWKFPQPRNGKNVGVNYPFMLRPVKS